MKLKRIIKIFYLTALILLATNTYSYSQIYKFKATSLASKYQMTSNNWSAWSDWEKTDVLIVMNLDELRIIIYSQEVQKYDIINIGDKSIDDDGNETMPLRCVDKDGLICNIRLVTPYSKNKNKQLYIDYKNFMIVYSYYVLN